MHTGWARGVWGLVMLGLVVGLGLAVGRDTVAQGGGRLYRETGHTLATPFVAYFDAHGGVPIFGYPLQDAETEGGRLVQYLERARLELHPEHAGTPYEVQLGLLGVTLTAGRGFAQAAAAEAQPAPGRLYFPETRHTLRGPFLAYWQAHGGLAQFGFPISEEVQEGGRAVQYFERNRFEAHPENRPPFDVLLGLLGRDLLARRVSLGEAQVTLPTYGYEAGFVPPEAGRPAAYPGLNPAAVGPARPRGYRLITLENRYLRLAIMPELGGRLYSVLYKATGHEELYRNPVVKPSPFGARGWWLGVGGAEWAFPTDEHGLLEYVPWTATSRRDGDGSATVTLQATDRQTGLQGTGEIRLGPDEAAYSLRVTLTNPTGGAQRTQLWINTMLAPGGANRVPRSSTWTLPGTALIVHSSDDPGAPAAGTRITWPRLAGRDLSDYSNWNGYLGAFVAPDARTGDYAALYNREADEGMVRVGPPVSTAQGIKIFGFGPHFDPNTYTDDDSSYAELWGGYLPTFADMMLLAPQATIGWTERWQPVAGLGGVRFANGWGSLNVGGGLLRLAPARPSAGTVIVRRGGTEVARKPFEVLPGAVLTLPVPDSGGLSVEVVDAGGQPLLRAPLD
ncbi:MAG TPA: DUF5107 domain-containing protein [Chloroflexia bacterium]|nr:DUF5107 domain-containing protein [Chloroflexia bacterium]